jgi:hypothetical protein
MLEHAFVWHTQYQEGDLPGYPLRFSRAGFNTQVVESNSNSFGRHSVKFEVYVPGIRSAKTSVPEARFDLERHFGIFEAKVNRRHAISGLRCSG